MAQWVKMIIPPQEGGLIVSYDFIPQVKFYLNKYIYILVGGLEHIVFFRILGMSSSQLTFIFFRGVEITNQ
jgi:hypothetical protein